MISTPDQQLHQPDTSIPICYSAIYNISPSYPFPTYTMLLAGVSSAMLLATAALAAPHAARSGNNVESKRADESAPNKTNIDINAIIPPMVPINTREGNDDLIAKLMTAPTQVERIKLLNQPGDFVFDFNEGSSASSTETKGKGGLSIGATSKTMPALIGNGESMTVGFLGPCGMNTPHVHNRATELNIVVQGRLVTNFVGENGAAPVANTLSRFQMTVFPQGAIHQEFNPDCEPTVFVAAFNDADPGVQTIAQNFFSLRPDVISATLGGPQTLNGEDIESFRKMIPANIALGIDACLNKCGIKRNAKRSIDEIMAEAR